MNGSHDGIEAPLLYGDWSPNEVNLGFRVGNWNLFLPDNKWSLDCRFGLKKHKEAVDRSCVLNHPLDRLIFHSNDYQIHTLFHQLYNRFSRHNPEAPKIIFKKPKGSQV